MINKFYIFIVLLFLFGCSSPKQKVFYDFSSFQFGTYRIGTIPIMNDDMKKIEDKLLSLSREQVLQLIDDGNPKNRVAGIWPLRF